MAMRTSSRRDGHLIVSVKNCDTSFNDETLLNVANATGEYILDLQVSPLGRTLSCGKDGVVLDALLRVLTWGALYSKISHAKKLFSFREKNAGVQPENNQLFQACRGPTLVGRRPGPSFFHVVGRGPARPIKFLFDGPRPDPTHPFFI